jgi:hypothetical protein
MTFITVPATRDDVASLVTRAAAGASESGWRLGTWWPGNGISLVSGLPADGHAARAARGRPDLAAEFLTGCTGPWIRPVDS